MSSSHDSIDSVSTPDSALRLLTKISANVISAPSLTAFGEQLAKVLVDDLAQAAIVCDVSPTGGGSRIAMHGDSAVIESLGMLKLAQDILANHRPTTAACAVTARPLAAGDSRCWVTAWLHAAGRSRACVLLLVDMAGTRAKVETLQQLKLATELASRFFDGAAMGRDAIPAAELHRSLDLTETSHAVANELRPRIGVDRVSVFLRRGRRFRLQSVSGQARLNHRSNVIRKLRDLVERTLRTHEPLCYPSEDELAPQIELALQAYLDESHAHSIRIVPLLEATTNTTAATNRSIPTIGALVFESFQPSQISHDAVLGAPLIKEAALAIQNAKIHSEILLLPLWRSLGRGLGRHPLAKLCVAAITCALCAAALYIIQVDYFVHASGTLRPANNRRLFAASDGIVADVLVDHGDRVEQGDILLELTNAEIDQRTDKVLGELQIARQQLAALATMRLRATRKGRANEMEEQAPASLAADQRQLEAQIENLTAQHESLKRQRERLSVVAPIAGEVVTWDVDRELRARPVNRGELLLTLEDIGGPWKLALDLPETSVQTLLERKNSEPSVPVHFILGTDPSHYHQAELTLIANRAQLDEKLGLSVSLEAHVPNELKLERRVGAEVRAKIPCGKHSLGYVLFHDAIDFVRTRLLFYLK